MSQSQSASMQREAVSILADYIERAFTSRPTNPWAPGSYNWGSEFLVRALFTPANALLRPASLKRLAEDLLSLDEVRSSVVGK